MTCTKLNSRFISGVDHHVTTVARAALLSSGRNYSFSGGVESAPPLVGDDGEPGCKW